MKKELKKIIIVNYRYFLSGGPEQYMFNFIELAKSKGVEIIPFSVNFKRNIHSDYSNYFASPPAGQNNINFAEMKKNPLSLFRIFINAIYNFEAKRKLSKLIHKVKPDLVYIIHQSVTLSPSVIDAAKKYKVPLIHRISDFNMVCPQNKLLRKESYCDLCLKGKYFNAVKYKCVQDSTAASTLRALSLYIHRKTKIYQRVDAFIATVNSTRDLLIEDGILTSDKIVTINTFIDTELIKPTYQFDNYVLALGRLHDEKGFFYAVKAMKNLKNTDIKLVITGNLIENSNIDNYIKLNNLQNNIVFTGFLDKDSAKKLLSNCLVVISPSIWIENLPNVVIESFAHGKSVIGSNFGSYLEIIDDNVNGFLVNPKSPEQISDKILTLYNNKLLAEEMGRNARQKAELRFNKELHWNSFLELYNKIT
jgi:glycosyltransferase involved in cell wall biosynthesis